MWTVLSLNVLLLRFRFGRVDGLAERIAILYPSLPLTARISCLGLAIASSHRMRDLRTTKRLACALARDVQSPWDLPTVPKLFLGAGKRVVVIESGSVGPMLQIIEELEALPDTTGQERSLLEQLAQRYGARGVS